MALMVHCAEFTDAPTAVAAAREVTRFRDEYAAYEGRLYRVGAQPYDPTSPKGPPPEALVAMGRKHGFEWPPSCGFLVRGSSTEIFVEHVGRLLFVYADAFELGGVAMKRVLASLGSVRYAQQCRLRCDVADAAQRARELVAFLEDEELADAFRTKASPHTMHSITVRDANGGATTLYFDDGGSMEEAFVALLPQLDGDDPRIVDAP